MIAVHLGERLLMAAAIIAACGATWVLLRAAVLRRAGRAPALPPFVPGLPGVVLFTTPQCVACRVQQRPALRELADRLAGRVQVIEIDATEAPDLARQWSVLSVPTTFVLDRSGRPLHVNHGVASVGKLLAQLPADA